MPAIPSKPNEVTELWLQEVLSQKYDYVKIESLKQHKNEGGVLSGIFKANVILNNVEKKLFIKIMPDPSQPQRVFIENFGIDHIEVQTYKKLFDKLEKFELEYSSKSDIKTILCQFYAGDSCQDPKDRKFYLILEDVGGTYKMPNLEEGLTYEQIVNSLKNLAYFHALSYAYGQVHKIGQLCHLHCFYKLAARWQSKSKKWK